ncbi:hypothetical protein WJX73_009582 [Symbiochloris irregularis]|uniref:Uncharacterized protein n=1 Tax=Symbiochloris irregularis TaxID=706552 RepID=A0AAW1PFM2_9CHLO
MSRTAQVKEYLRDSAVTYGQDLKQLPYRLRHRAFKTETYEEMRASADLASKNPMKRSLSWPTLALLCIGHMIGGGIFILTGLAARTEAGPAVIISYLIGGLIAFITACNYSEMGADYPLAGASFNYVLAVWGEFPAWITIVAIAIDALLGAGALARGWSSYLATLCNQPSDKFLIHTSHHDLDFVAFGLIILVFIIIAWGTHQTSTLNTGHTPRPLPFLIQGRASLGMLVSKMTTVRDLLVMARHGLVPGKLAYISRRTGTPIYMIILYGIVCAIVALLTDFTTLAKLTNVGSLFVVCMIAGVVLWRRFYKQYRPQGFKTPLVPLSCSFCIFAGIFLIGSAGYQACYRFGIVLGVCVVCLLSCCVAKNQAAVSAKGLEDGITHSDETLEYQDVKVPPSADHEPPKVGGGAAASLPACSQPIWIPGR